MVVGVVVVERVVARVMVGVMVVIVVGIVVVVGLRVVVGLEVKVWSRLIQCDQWPMRPCLTECDLPDSR